MTMFAVAFDRQTRVATILDKGAAAPDGSDTIGEINVTAVSPNPTDASTQHIHNLLYRNGITDMTGVRVVRQSLADVIDESNRTTAAEMQKELDDGLPQRVDLEVEQSIDLVEGTTKGMTFDVAGDDVVKLDKRNAKVTALAAGKAIVKVTTGDVVRNVEITVRDKAPVLDDKTDGDKEEAKA